MLVTLREVVKNPLIIGTATKMARHNWREGCGLTDLQKEIAATVKEKAMRKLLVCGSMGRG